MGRIWPWRRPPVCPICAGPLTRLLDTLLVSCPECEHIFDVDDVIRWNRQSKRLHPPSTDPAE